MNEEAYSTFTHDQLILRDVLAADRTVLANERTLLSYVRTALTLIVVGLTVVKIFEATFVYAAFGWVFLVTGCATLVYGLFRFRRNLAVIRKAKTAFAPDTPPILPGKPVEQDVP